MDFLISTLSAVLAVTCFAFVIVLAVRLHSVEREYESLLEELFLDAMQPSKRRATWRAQ